MPDAENYFDNLGFEKPARVNPADFYMDVIGGMCEANQSQISSLPEQWEEHASRNNAGASGIQSASSDPSNSVVGQAEVVEPDRASFYGSDEQMIVIKDSQGKIIQYHVREI